VPPERRGVHTAIGFVAMGLARRSAASSPG
jgi:hypothetical protein